MGRRPTAPTEAPINAGEEIVNNPTGIGLDPDAQFRTLSARLEEVAKQVAKIEPKTFRLADVINLAVIFIALIVAIFTAIGIKDRIDDLGKVQASSELRVTGQLTATENRLSARMEKLDDRFTRLDERTATIEGMQRGKAVR